MIVNPAYAYMGKAAPANPVIFQKNEINYQYSGQLFKIESEGIMMTPGANITFSGLDLTKFTKVTIKGHHFYTYPLSIDLVYIDSSGIETVKVSKQFTGNASNVWDIPPEYRMKNCKIRLSTPSQQSISIRMDYAILS